MLGIAVYGIWRTRGSQPDTYLKGDQTTAGLTIGISVMATQASAITFISTPGQGIESGLGFVQNYFGMPLALIIVAAVFLPIYRRLNVYTAYEFLGRRFDAKTRLLGAALFLLQRGLAAGITIYAPAIMLSTVLGWRLDLTIVLSGLLVIVYTVSGRQRGGEPDAKIPDGGHLWRDGAGLLRAAGETAGGLSATRCTSRAVSRNWRRWIFHSMSTGATLSGPACSAACFCRCRISAPTSRRCSVTFRAPRCARAGWA